MSKRRPFFVAALFACAVALLGATAAADDSAQTFVQREHSNLSSLLRQPASPARDSQVDGALARMIDYAELTRRAFGEPCHPSLAGCTNHWAKLTPEQRAEVTDLLRRLIEKNQRKNITKTLDYDISYKGFRDSLGESKVRTEAKSKLKPRDPPIQVDYVVCGGGNPRVCDIVTEGSSLTKNYYDQFNRMLTNPAQGYPHVVKKLNEKIAKNDTK
jgi:ABC-type transporter MlaC component